MLQAIVTRGNRNESKMIGPLVGSVVQRENRWPTRLAGDKGYSSDKIRLWLMKRKVRDVIPMRKTEHMKDRDRWPRLIKAAYRRRNVMERCVGKLKEFRRIATRYEKLAESFIGMVNVACIVLFLRLLDSCFRA